MSSASSVAAVFPAARRFLCAALLGTAALLAGCASPWQENFVRESWAGGAAPSAPLSAETAVEVRAAPWERVQAAQTRFNTEVVNSDTRPEEWPPDKKAAAKAELLRGLQISADPASVDLVGHSSFRSTTLMRPESGDSSVKELQNAARRVGANTVVWSRSLLGQTESIVNEPVTTHTFGDVSHVEARGRHYHVTNYNESSTTWVPVAIQEDEYGYVAFFLFKGPGRGGDAAP